MRTTLLHFLQCIYQESFPPLRFAADMEARGTSSGRGWLCTKLPVTSRDYHNVLQTTNKYLCHAFKMILHASSVALLLSGTH